MNNNEEYEYTYGVKGLAICILKTSWRINMEEEKGAEESKRRLYEKDIVNGRGGEETGLVGRWGRERKRERRRGKEDIDITHLKRIN